MLRLMHLLIFFFHLCVFQVKLTPAEKQRRYREKRDMDPEKRAAYLQKEREKYVMDKQSGKKKSVVQMTNKEQKRKGLVILDF